jgi:anti-sigma regulatory factor (Ser/Thr protein kinase)
MVAVETDARKDFSDSPCRDARSMRTRRRITETMARVLDSRVLRSETFPADARQIAHLRKVIRETVADHSAFDTIVLLASEAATNSFLHSGSTFIGLVIARTTNGDLRVAVIDEGMGGLPRLHDDVRGEEHGRGLYLMDRLALSWGVIRRHGVGSAVWFDIR